MLEFAAQAERHLSGPEYGEQDRWIRRLQRDHANIRAALRYTIERGDLEAAASGLWCIHGFLWSRGYASELQAWAEELLRGQDQLSIQARARVTYAAGLAAQMRSDLLVADALLGDALELSRGVGDLRVVGLCLLLLAYSGLPRRGIAHAADMLRQSAEQFRLAGDAWGEAFTVGGLGELALLDNDLGQAQQQFEDYVARCRARGDVRGLGQGLQALGTVHLRGGTLSAAKGLYLEALPLCRRTNNQDRVALCLGGLAQVAVEQSEWTQAARWIGAAEGVGSNLGWISRQSPQAELSERIRAQLGEQGFIDAHAEGRAHPVEDLLPDLVEAQVAQ
jgi:hypothetical protein